MERISASYEPHSLFVRPGQGIAAEMALLRGEDAAVDVLSSTDACFPSMIRSNLKDAEWNPHTGPVRSPESRTPGYIPGEGMPLLDRWKVKAPGQPRTPYPKQRRPPHLDPLQDTPKLAEPPAWFTTATDYHHAKPRSGHGPLIAAMAGSGKGLPLYSPPRKDRKRESRSTPNRAPYIPPTLLFERKVW